MDLAGCTTPVFLSAETLRLWTTVRVSSDRGFLRLGPITSNTSHWLPNHACFTNWGIWWIIGDPQFRGICLSPLNAKHVVPVQMDTLRRNSWLSTLARHEKIGITNVSYSNDRWTETRWFYDQKLNHFAWTQSSLRISLKNRHPPGTDWKSPNSHGAMGPQQVRLAHVGWQTRRPGSSLAAFRRAKPSAWTTTTAKQHPTRGVWTKKI